MKFAQAFKKCVEDPFINRVQWFLDLRLYVYERKLAKEFARRFGF
jgi:hypothetical protein